MSKRATLSIFLLALAARTAWVLVSSRNPDLPDEMRLWTEITHFAERLSMTERSVDMPLVPVLWGLAHKFLGLGPLGVKLLHCLASAATVFPAMGLARELHPSAKAEALAGLATALCPYLVYISGSLLTEPLFILLLTWALYLLAGRRITGFFAVMALAHLARPTALYFLPVAAAWLLFIRPANQEFGDTSKKILLGLGLFALLVAPWAARNLAVHHEFMLGKPSGHPIWEGNNPWNKDGGVKQEWWKTTPIEGWGTFYTMPEGLSFMQEEAWFKQRAVRFIKENPGRFLELCALRLGRFWSPWPNDASLASPLRALVGAVFYIPLFLLAWASVWVLRDRWRTAGVLWLFAAYYTALHVVTIGSIRYRLPIEPLLAALAAACLARLWAARQGRPHA